MLTSCTYIRSRDRFECKAAGESFSFVGHCQETFGRAQNFNIEEVHLKYQEVNHILRGLGSFFPRLWGVNSSHCGLKSIMRDDLIGLEELEHLSVTSNLLRSLPSDLFIGMTRLRCISFKDNKLETMSSELLEPISRNDPVKIDFRGNFKIHAVYDPTDADGISLEQLMELIDTDCEKLADEQDHASTVDSFKDDFTAGLADLLESGDHSDFTIIANGPKEFRVHKNVLAIQSSVFAAIFKNKMKETQTGKMTISDFSAEAIKQFLAYLCTGKIKDVSYAMELFELAAKYDVPKLRAASEQNILHQIDDSNAGDVFALGHLHSSTVMKRNSFDAIKQTLPDIELDKGLVDEPEPLEILIDAVKNRKRKMQEVDAGGLQAQQIESLKLCLYNFFT